MLCTSNTKKILVFLPEPFGATIAVKLLEHGFQPVSVSTVPEAFDALRSDEFAFAITNRLDIDLLRNIRALPVINLEVFFHAKISNDTSPVNLKRSDSKSFLERVEFLSRAASDSGSDRVARANTARTHQRNRVRWWVRAARALQIGHSRKGMMDAQS
ncbi:hypothetical protein JZX87_26180 [Agrobacterium sp. Ap1]|nr:hypothetical protein [Agrobacterium sp. Ap1]